MEEEEEGLRSLTCSARGEREGEQWRAQKKIKMAEFK